MESNLLVLIILQALPCSDQIAYAYLLSIEHCLYDSRTTWHRRGTDGAFVYFMTHIRRGDCGGTLHTYYIYLDM